MKYTEHEIIDILKLTCDNPEKVLLKWNNNKANTPVEFGAQVRVRDQKINEIIE